MTNRELEKEATEFEANYTVYEVAESENGTNYAKKKCNVTLKEAYIAGAEPREKQIAELEKENKTVSRKANEAIADKLLITAKYNEVLNDLNQKNDKLQKKNADLEAQIEKMKSDVLSLIKDRMNDDIDQNIIERLAEKWERKEK